MLIKNEILDLAGNNHYAGFGPGTVNIFRNMIELPEDKWEETIHTSLVSQQGQLTI
jgi:hypothetical protein